MVIKNVNLEIVCGVTSKVPDTAYAEVAFAGKSNVGKSSLMNQLIGQKIEPQSTGTYFRTAWKNADHQLLQYQRCHVPCRSSGIRLCKGIRGSKGKVGKNDRKLSSHFKAVKGSLSFDRYPPRSVCKRQNDV